MNTEHRAALNTIFSKLSDEDIEFWCRLGCRVASRDEATQIIESHSLPSNITSYAWLIIEGDIVIDNLDIPVPLIAKGNITVKKNIRTHYHSALIALKDVKAKGIFLEGESHLLGKTYFDFLGCSETNGPEQVIKHPFGKIGYFTADSSEIDNRKNIECYQYSVMDESKGDFRHFLKTDYIDDQRYKEELEYYKDQDENIDNKYDTTLFMSMVSLNHEKLYDDILNDEDIFLIE